jgi:hypothetical protein
MSSVGFYRFARSPFDIIPDGRIVDLLSAAVCASSSTVYRSVGRFLTIFKVQLNNILDSSDSDLINSVVLNALGTTLAVDSHEVSDESQINVDRQVIKAQRAS